MNGQEFTDTLTDAHETPLSRLGSSKWIYALTGGEMTGDAVDAAWGREARAAHDVFSTWADEADDPAAGTFADVATTLADSADAAGDDEDAPLYETLVAVEGDVARAGGLLAWTVVTERTLAQMVGFFVGDADPSTANDYRGYRGDVQDARAAAEELLDAVCADDADWETAREAAADVVEAAYEDYVETLESMGIKPKNVC